jgi:hypothetical protein
MTELEDDDDREEVSDSEPSLGSFDRMVDQDKSWRTVMGEDHVGTDCELDDCDREDDDPVEQRDRQNRSLEARYWKSRSSRLRPWPMPSFASRPAIRRAASLAMHLMPSRNR